MHRIFKNLISYSETLKLADSFEYMNYLNSFTYIYEPLDLWTFSLLDIAKISRHSTSGSSDLAYAKARKRTRGTFGASYRERRLHIGVSAPTTDWKALAELRRRASSIASRCICALAAPAFASTALSLSSVSHSGIRFASRDLRAKSCRTSCVFFFFFFLNASRYLSRTS